MTERKKSHQEEYAEKIAKELIERLKQGTAPFQLPWQPDMGRDFPFNPVSGTEYSGMNRLNLMIQGYSDPRWMTYKKNVTKTDFRKLVPMIRKNIAT